MTPQNKELDPKKRLLYTYWHNLPFFKAMEPSNYYQMEESEVKSFIIKYIRDGLEDEFSKKFDLPRRHAFTVKELYNAYLKKESSQKYSLSNFHFHIKSLVKDGYLKEIAKFLEGRHYVTYYGRTAVNFMGLYDNILTDSSVQDIFGPLKQMSKEINPEIDSEEINQLIDENLLLLQDFYYRLFLWIKEKYPLLYKCKVDIRKLVEVIGHYAFFHKEFAKNSERVGALIDLDKIMEYERYDAEEEDRKGVINRKKDEK
jgi:hypothetical protein